MIRFVTLLALAIVVTAVAPPVAASAEAWLPALAPAPSGRTALPLAASEVITPGIILEGHVARADGTSLPDVTIYRNLASYPGVVVATTDEEGFYRSDFFYIPGVEMVGVWAKRPGYFIVPLYYRFYFPGGTVTYTLDFAATPWRLFVPVMFRSP